MCGIFGIVASRSECVSGQALKALTKALFRKSSIRGQDASGVFSVNSNSIQVIKSSGKAAKLIKTKLFNQFLQAACKSFENNEDNFAVFGQTRMSTSGSVEVPGNNQPVIKNRIVILHNGIIINYNKIWQELKNKSKEFDVDTEVFGALITKFSNQGLSWEKSFQQAFLSIKGANTICAVQDYSNDLYLVTSNGSLYFAKNENLGLTCFASEKAFLKNSLTKINGHFSAKSQLRIFQPKNNKVFCLDLKTSALFPINRTCKTKVSNKKKSRTIYVSALNHKEILKKTFCNSYQKLNKILEKASSFQANLKRCTKCLLPTSFPFISFDKSGVCNFCLNYQSIKLKGLENLRKISNEAKKYTSKNENCLVPISGGRDSCYGLYFCKKQLGLNPVAYTYDWGFVTDLARRNISRMCGELGVQHILVAADIKRKRYNVQKNVRAWLAKPSLALIPLFMAGDKPFFYFASKIQKEMQLGPIIFSMNWLERTEFKTGFAGVNEQNKFSTTYGLSAINKLKLVWHYLFEFIMNPRYINLSVFDTFFGFSSYYLKSKDYYSIFDYIAWNQQEIEGTLEHKFGWERSPDTKATWRIGDGTAPFYNYIYHTVAGFSEHDTFRSNQIREGLITRSDGMRYVEEENLPRADSLKWYFDMINIDAVEAVKIINKIPKLY